MKPIRQILSALTATAMSMTLMPGILHIQREETQNCTQTAEDIQYSAESPLGALVLGSICHTIRSSH